jgi:uncharacterized membrane protein
MFRKKKMSRPTILSLFIKDKIRCNNSLHLSRANLINKKHWNLYADETFYKMNFWLNFIKPSFDSKFNRDMYKRTEYTFAAILFHLIAIFIYHCYAVESKHSVLSNIAVLICLVIVLVLRFYNISPYYVRLWLTFPILTFHNILGQQGIPLFISIFIINLPIDLCLSMPWKKFMFLSFANIYLEKWIFGDNDLHNNESYFWLFLTVGF